MSHWIIVKNLPYEISQEEIIQLISTTSNPKFLDTILDAQGRTKGISYVEYISQDDAKNSIKLLNGLLFHGNRLMAEMVKKENGKYLPLQENTNKSPNNEVTDEFKKIQGKLYNKVDKLLDDLHENPLKVLNNPFYNKFFDEDDRSEIINKMKSKRNHRLSDQKDNDYDMSYFNQNDDNQNESQFVHENDDFDAVATKNAGNSIQNNNFSPSPNNIEKDEIPKSGFLIAKSNIKSSFMSQSEKHKNEAQNEDFASNGCFKATETPFNLNNDPEEKNSSDSYDDSQFNSDLQQSNGFTSIDDSAYSTHLPRNSGFTPNNGFHENDIISPRNGFGNQDYRSTDRSVPYSSSGRFSSSIDPQYLPSRNARFSSQEISNQRVFQENIRIIQSGQYTDSKGQQHDIAQKVSDSIANTITINKNYSYYQVLAQQLSQTKKWGRKEKNLIYSKIEVTNESTFEAARRWKRTVKEVCALNFASAVKPGGGVINGRTAQEESLSRQSSLFFSLKSQNEMYDYHQRHPDDFYSDYMIYSPNVVVFRDSYNNLCYPIRVSVISSPAVNCSRMPSHSRREAVKTMKNRCRKILQLGMATNNKVMILGAFGCGVFGNNPDDMSKIFKELLVDEFYGMFFTKVVFAIKGKGNQKNPNFDAFKNAFKNRGWLG